MNYTLKSINQIDRNEVAQNAEYDRQYYEESTLESRPLFGTPYRIEVELIQDECPVYLSLLAGSTAGIQLEHTDKNYSMLEAYPSAYMVDLLATIEADFPHIIDHNLYEDQAELATKFLASKGNTVVREGTIVTIELPNELAINLSKKDIEYYAEIYKEETNES